MVPEPCTISSSGGRAPLTLARVPRLRPESPAVAHHSVNLKPRRGLDDGLDLVQVADTRQFHQNLVFAQAIGRNQRLAHVPRHPRGREWSRWPAVRSSCPDPFDDRLHGQRPGIVAAAAVESRTRWNTCCRAGSAQSWPLQARVPSISDHSGLPDRACKPGKRSGCRSSEHPVRGHRVVGFVADRFGDLHLQNQVRAALQIQAQMNAIGYGLEQGLPLMPDGIPKIP
jgi:hypothetical protein